MANKALSRALGCVNLFKTAMGLRNGFGQLVIWQFYLSSCERGYSPRSRFLPCVL